MNRNESVELFRDMILCCHNLYLWEFSHDMTLLETNCPEAEILIQASEMNQWKETLCSYGEKHGKPLIMSIPAGLCFVAIPTHPEEEEHCIYVLGPFQISDLSPSEVSAALKKSSLPSSLHKRVSDFVAGLPVLSLSRIFEYTIMLYFCLTGEKILVSDIHYQQNEPAAGNDSFRQQKTDIHGTYAMEQEMVRMVREGNLDYQKHMSRLAVSGRIGKLSDSSERQIKNSVLVCIVLFSRAAIEGGLSPEIAMTLTDHYFQSVEACKNIQELQAITRTMQDDFVQRVHRVRSSRLSKPVRECRDYMDMHTEDDLTLKETASRLGYSEYYLSHRFRHEMGISFRDYLTRRRLSRAEDLLRNSALTIKDISEKLRFCSQSYFAEQFKAVYGMSPSQWRENH